MRPTVFLKSVSVLFLFALLGAIYFWCIRPGQLVWGATAAEIARAMPEDQLVIDPVFDATRAITIHAKPEQIYPWLVQMGYGRAGFYGYDLIENFASSSGIRSAQTLVPALQNPRPGDPLPISIAATLVYGPAESNHYVVWRSADNPCNGVFIWELVPAGANETRLISRIRWNYEKSPGGLPLGVFTEFTDHVAVRKILQGVRDRAEGLQPESLTREGIEIGSWFFAALNFLITLLYVAFWRKWAWAWAMALAAGLIFEFVLYGSMPLVIRVLLPCLSLVGIVAAWLNFGRYQNTVQYIPR